MDSNRDWINFLILALLAGLRMSVAPVMLIYTQKEEKKEISLPQAKKMLILLHNNT